MCEVVGAVTHLDLSFVTNSFSSSTPVTFGEYQPWKKMPIGPDIDEPNSSIVCDQAWDLRGSAGGAPLSNFRDGFSVSASMGTTPRMVDFSQGDTRMVHSSHCCGTSENVALGFGLGIESLGRHEVRVSAVHVISTEFAREHGHTVAVNASSWDKVRRVGSSGALPGKATA